MKDEAGRQKGEGREEKCVLPVSYFILHPSSFS
jgi:hypothetical protein